MLLAQSAKPLPSFNYSSPIAVNDSVQIFRIRILDTFIVIQNDSVDFITPILSRVYINLTAKSPLEGTLELGLTGAPPGAA
jgi:hypothetical protein